MALTVNSKLCLRRMEMQQKYGCMRNTILETKRASKSKAKPSHPFSALSGGELKTKKDGS